MFLNAIFYLGFKYATIVCIFWAAVEFVLHLSTQGANPFNWWSAILTATFALGQLFATVVGIMLLKREEKETKTGKRSKFQERLEQMRRNHEDELGI